MNRFRKSHGMGAWLAALASISLWHSAEAIPWDNGYSGSVTFYMSSLENVSVYTVQDGLYGSSSNVGVGLAALDVLPQTVPLFGKGGEDAFGIFVVDTVLGSHGEVAYDKATSGFTLAALTYNSRDVALTVSGSSEVVSSVGLRVDLYELPVNPNLLTNADPSDHTGPGAFNNITNVPGATNPVLRLSAHAGLFGSAGPSNPGGALTSLLQTIDFSTLTGTGKAYLDVTGGTDSSQFNNNSEFGGTDMALEFTIGTDPQVYPNYHAPWLLADSDPASVTALPEPANALTGLACLIPMLRAIVSRRRQTATPAL